jgi:hypothetical protein
MTTPTRPASEMSDEERLAMADRFLAFKAIAALAVYF